MCGRFTLRTPAAHWCQLFLPDVDPARFGAADDAPRYNIAPTQSIHCVIRNSEDSSRALMKARWGLVPGWANELSIGSRMINARGETVDEKPSFRNALKKQRCLIPADGYFEWKAEQDGKQPFLMHRPAHAMFVFAGLWETNSKAAPDGTIVCSCTIITTSANAATQTVHDRMPVILDETEHDKWLDPAFQDVGQLKALLHPAEENYFQVTRVSRHVNHVKHQDAACVEPI